MPDADPQTTEALPYENTGTNMDTSPTPYGNGSAAYSDTGEYPDDDPPDAPGAESVQCDSGDDCPAYGYAADFASPLRRLALDHIERFHKPR